MDQAQAAERSPTTFQERVGTWRGARRAFTAKFQNLSLDTAKEWMAFFNDLNGPEGTFWATDPLAGDVRGACGDAYAFAAIATTQTWPGTDINSNGWPPATVGVLKAGDWISVGGEHPRLYQVCADVDSDSSGSALIPVWPPVMSDHEDLAAIQVGSDSRGLFRLVEWPEHKFDVHHMMVGFSFKAVEVNPRWPVSMPRPQTTTWWRQNGCSPEMTPPFTPFMPQGRRMTVDGVDCWVSWSEVQWIGVADPLTVATVQDFSVSYDTSAFPISSHGIFSNVDISFVVPEYFTTNPILDFLNLIPEVNRVYGWIPPTPSSLPQVRSQSGLQWIGDEGGVYPHFIIMAVYPYANRPMSPVNIEISIISDQWDSPLILQSQMPGASS
jgi:hypothetical protein